MEQKLPRPWGGTTALVVLAGLAVLAEAPYVAVAMTALACVNVTVTIAASKPL